jgi:hypothetical protein
MDEKALRKVHTIEGYIEVEEMTIVTNLVLMDIPI